MLSSDSSGRSRGNGTYAATGPGRPDKGLDEGMVASVERDGHDRGVYGRSS